MPALSPTAGTSELVMLSLELVKTRLAVMSMEMRKSFIQAILTSLIEKSPDAKILRAVVKIVEEWVKNNSPMAANQVSCKESALAGDLPLHGRKVQMSLSQLFHLKSLKQNIFLSRIRIHSIFPASPLRWIFLTVLNRF